MSDEQIIAQDHVRIFLPYTYIICISPIRPGIGIFLICLYNNKNVFHEFESISNVRSRLRGYWYLNGKWYYPFVASPSIPVPVRVTRITFFRNSTIGSQRITDLPRTPSQNSFACIAGVVSVLPVCDTLAQHKRTKLNEELCDCVRSIHKTVYVV